MDELSLDEPPDVPRGLMPQWAIEVLHSVAFCRTASRVAAVLAGVAGAAGLATAVLYVVQDTGSDDVVGISMDTYRWGPALTIVLQTAFYVGLLVTASALLRLQASRLESEVFGEEFDED